MPSSHEFLKDKRNNNIKIYVNGKFYNRKNANISVFDSSVLLGDGVWDGLRYHNNKFLFLNDHIKRLYEDAKKINLKIHLSQKSLKNLLLKTIRINKMKTDAHLRLIVSRGIKSTPYQSPKVTISKPTIIIIPEYKKPDNKIYKRGLKLVTVSIIRGPKNVQDPQINSLSKLNCILACIEASKKGADEALMLDINNNIATNNSTHFFYVKNKTVFTSKGKFCVNGITRKKVIEICKLNKIKVKEKNFKLKDVMRADEAFATGTFGGVVPINKINNKRFSIKKDNLTFKILNLYNQLINK